MAEIQSCAFCGQQFAANTMDVTGLGLRCQACSVNAMFANPTNNPMVGNLTIPEMEAIVGSSTREAWLGAAGLVAGGFVAAIIPLGVPHKFLGAFIFASFGMVVHGLYRRKVARAALREAPAARAIQRT